MYAYANFLEWTGMKFKSKFQLKLCNSINELKSFTKNHRKGKRLYD